jgi:hypothetical protein
MGNVARSTCVLAVVLASLLCGCSDDDGRGGAASATPTSPPDSPPTLTPTRSPSITATSMPATSTPTVTPTETATPTPSPTVRLNFEIRVSEPRFVVPSDALPDGVEPLASNNNEDIFRFDSRLFLAWRTAPAHFAGPDTLFYILSSADDGTTWELEHTIDLDTDMREPRFTDIGGYLQLMFFEAGSNPGAFEPKRLLRTRRGGFGQWSDVEVLTDAGEVPWDVKVHDGIAYRTSYQGEHYGAGETSEISVFFKQSTDGTTWTSVGGKQFAYFGGVSEVAFEFDADGSLWLVTRNEDGDASGFGSHVCYAPAGALGDWQCPAQTDPERYDSPKMFRHGDEIYLIARRDIGGPYDTRDEELTLAERRGRYLVAYSLRPKRTALYHIDKETRSVVHVRDLPGVGDTAFPAVLQTGPDTYLLANYTSPLDQPDISWLRGQTSPRGTQIYLADIEFVPYSGPTYTPTPTEPPTPTPTAQPTVEGERVTLTPVFAAPGIALDIDWQDLVGVLDLGDGTSIGPEVSSHAYAGGAAVFPINGAIESGGAPVNVAGAVARTDRLAFTPLNGFTLTEPLEDVVQQVIRGVMPAFYYAFDVDTFAVGADPTGQAMLHFDEIGTGALSVDGAAFRTVPIDLNVELSGPGGTASGLRVRLAETVWTGTFEGAAPASPIHLAGRLSIDDIVGVVEVLAGLDRETAVAFIAGLFGFDPNDPPELLPFRADLAVQPGP